MASYRLTPAARADFREIGRYTQRRWGADQRAKYLAALVKAFALLARNPHRGRHREDLRPGLRSFHCGQHIVFYREGPFGVEILRLLHGARDLPALLAEAGPDAEE